MISVIIPIYNAEPYLGRCINSVLRSNYEDFELILVDDGSTDGCLRICEEYAGTDPRITVLSQENKGVSTARNRGLEVCRGEWVIFVDADDCISPDHLPLVAGAEDTDLLLFDFAVSREELTSGIRPGTVLRYGPADMPDLAERVLAPRQLRKDGQVNFRSSNGKAFKKSVIDRYGLRFPAEISYGEDKLFNLDYILRAESCAYLPAPVYFYEAHASSLSQSFHPERLDGLIAWMEKYYGRLGQNHASPAVTRAYNDYTLDYIVYILSEVIFNPLNPSSLQEQYDTCACLRKKLGAHPVLKQNLRLGPLERRIFLFFFNLGWYRTLSLLCAAARLRRKIRARMGTLSGKRKNGGNV